jgi:long-chain acyl-CoA synthetase
MHSAFKHDGSWIKYSSQDYIDHSFNFCYGLYEMGFRKGDKIMSVSTNRPEWNFADMGMAMLGVVHVPVFTSLNVPEYEYIINNSGARMVIVSDSNLYKCISPCPGEAGQSVKVCSHLTRWRGFKLDGDCRKRQIMLETTRNEVEKIKAGIDPETFAVLIYTSGTTGRSKGVMLSHKNLTTNFIAAASVFNLKPTDKYLSILPLCHVGGRMGNYQTQYSGAGPSITQRAWEPSR